MARQPLVVPWFLALALVACGPYDSGAPAESASAPALENGSFRDELNGFGIHYEVHGQGPVVMVVPNSWGFDINGLRVIYGGLEDRLTMVYFDPRGMGESDPLRVDADMGLAAVRDDFDALRRHLGLDRVHAIGWSNGATNLVALAAERPETLASAIFLHGTATYSVDDQQRFIQQHPDLAGRYIEVQQALADPGLDEAGRNAIIRDVWVGELFPASCADPAWCRENLPAIFEPAAFSWRHAMYAGQESPTFDLLDRLPRIVAPSLVIAGAHDTTPVAKAEEMRDGIAGAKMVLLEDSGHFAPLEQPERFREAVLGFLDAS